MTDPEPPFFSWRRYIWLLLLATLTLKAVYWQQLRATLYVEKQLNSSFTDMTFFNEWAEAISQGDWASADVGHPINDNARRMLLDHWRAEGRVPPRDEHDPLVLRDRLDAQWNAWFGEKAFHQAPLFPYLLGLMYSITGVLPWLWILLQFGIGLVNITLIVDITRRIFDGRTAQAAGIMALAVTPVWFYEGVLLRTTLIQLVSLGLVWTLLTSRPMFWRGMLTATAILIKPIFVLAIPLGLTKKESRGSIGLFGVGLALGLAPFIWRNLQLDRPALELSSIGTYTLLRSNASDIVAGNGWQPSLHAARMMETHDGQAWPLAKELAGQRSWLQWLSHLGGKIRHVMHDFEIPNNVDFEILAHDVPVLDFGVGCGLIVPFFIFGLPLLWRKRQCAWPLWCIGTIHLLSILVFYNLGRFRAPLVTLAIPVAAAGILWLWNLLSEEDQPKKSTWAMIGIVLLGLVSLPAHNNETIKRAERDLIIWNFELARNRVSAVLENEPDNAKAHWIAARANIRTGRVDQALKVHIQACLSSFQFREQALREAARIHFREALRNDPNSVAALENAALRYGQAMLTNPFSASTRANLGLTSEYLGNLDAAYEQYLIAVHLDPAIAAGHAGLGNIALQDNDDSLAISYYQRAINLYLDNPYIKLNIDQSRNSRLAIYCYRMGLALRALGKITEAREAFIQALVYDESHELSREALKATSK